jgi:hypothetical protein
MSARQDPPAARADRSILESDFLHDQEEVQRDEVAFLELNLLHDIAPS